MNLKDRIETILNNVLIRGGGEALMRATGTREEWEATPKPTCEPFQAKVIKALNQKFGDDHTDELLDRTWMQGERQAAHKFVDHVFNEYEMWAVTARPDLCSARRGIS